MDTITNKRPVSAFVLAWLFLIGGVAGFINSLIKIFAVGQWQGFTDLIFATFSLLVAYGLFKMRRWALIVLTIFVGIQAALWVYQLMSSNFTNPTLLMVAVVVTVYLWIVRQEFN